MKRHRRSWTIAEKVFDRIKNLVVAREGDGDCSRSSVKCNNVEFEMAPKCGENYRENGLREITDTPKR